MAGRSELLAILRETAKRAEGGKLSLGAVIDQLQDASFTIVGLLICLPFLFPLPILGPLTIPGGLAIAAIGWQMIRGAEKVQLPKRFAAIELSSKAWGALASVAEKLLRFVERFAKPRLSHWTEGKRGEARAGWFVMIGGVLLAIPMGGVLPFNNSLPAMAAICACIALLESDGLWFAYALFWLIITVLYFTAFVIVLIYFGDQFQAWLKAHLPAWLG